MQHQHENQLSSPSSAKRSILDTSDQQLSPRHHSRGPSSPHLPIDTSSIPTHQQVDPTSSAYAYRYHRSQRPSIDSTLSTLSSIPSPQDLAREYLHSPGLQHSSPLSDPSPIITTPVSTKLPLDQSPAAISKDVDFDQLDRHDQTSFDGKYLTETDRFPTSGDLKGLGIYPLHTGPAARGATLSYREAPQLSSPPAASPRDEYPTVIHNNRSVAFHIHFPTSPKTADKIGHKVNLSISHDALTSPRTVTEPELKESAMATLEAPGSESKSTPRPMSATSARRQPPPPLAHEGSYIYAQSDPNYGLAPSGAQAGEGSTRAVQLRASTDPSVGGAGYTGMTPTPSRHTFDSAGVQMPEIQTQPEQAEQNQSLPALKTVVQDDSAFGPLPVMEHNSAPAQMYEGPNGTPIGEGFPPSARPYRRSFTSYSAGAGSRKSSMSYNEPPHTRAPSYHVQHVVSPTAQSAQAYWIHPPSYVQMAPRSSGMTEGLVPVHQHGEAQAGPVSLPGFNQLYVQADHNGGRSASAGHQMSMQQQQHMHMQRQGVPQGYQIAPQQRLQPMQTRHLPFPPGAAMQHYSTSNGMQPPVHYYSHPPPTTLVGWDANGNPEYSYAGPQNGMPVYVQQGMPVQEFVSYPPHAFQNGHAMPPQTVREGEKPAEDESNPNVIQPHAGHHNVFAYQYAPGEDMDMDAPTPSVHGAHPEEGEQTEEMREVDRLEDAMSEPDSEIEQQQVDSAEEEWIPESFKKKKKGPSPKSASKKKKGKGGKVTPKATPPRKGTSKKVLSSPTVQTPLEKGKKVIIRLPPLMPIESNLIRFTSLAEEKQTDTLKRECYTCGCRDPPSWRKSTLAPARILCNRCGIYERSHKRTRPIGDVEMRSVSVAATAAKKSKAKGPRGPPKQTQAMMNVLSAGPMGAYSQAPAGYTSGGHAMYPSYGQENDARRVSSVSGLPPGITDPAGYSTKGGRVKKPRGAVGKGRAPQNKTGVGSFKTFTNCATYSGVPRMEPYQYALAAHRSDLTSSVPLEKANGSGRPSTLHRSASAMPASANVAPWGNPYGEDEEEDE